MSLEFIGFIAPTESSESLAPRGPNVDPGFIKAFAQAQEYGGFDKALIAVNTAWPDSFAIGAWVAAATERLGILVAHRPGFQAPTFAARQFATLDQLSGGRASINVITGGDGGDLQRDGDYLPHDERYTRTDEYLDVVRKVWTSDKPFDHEGQYYRIQDNHTLVKPVQKPHLPVFFSGASDAAVRVAAKHADVYMMWGETLEQIRTRVAQVRAEAAKYGRDKHIRFSISFRPILGATEEEAWGRAARILASAKELIKAESHARFRAHNKNVGSERLVDLAHAGRVHDKRLWTEIAALTGATGNSTSLVGTPDQVAEAVAEYYDLGVDTFLFRGYDPLRDAVEYGQDLIPRIRALVAARETGGLRKVG
ncbi:LLM class flavin-dependent oxidoreductase [Pseudothauera rhizosphaerae]|uniref:LLM class flavin-dependent oxidoreductase n=1 Tax=Pseudothauera rhizosphaerae TaxID=2565932 RepID=A0A4S4AYP5_9RHOO|nr:LLM class flavin-dependent oxidoreductase [Pseudothauera rhizosphaerae]THF65286.1 LLM class flavin-dependent oxidoreductase [Pseudothauera rhizosphaerae]